MPRFVLLDHDHPVPHWDLMLEQGEALATWRLGLLPGPGEGVPAERIADHRRAYLDYEGPVSGGRGRVVRCDAGTYQVRCWSEEQVEVEVEGGELRGVLILTREALSWRLTYHPRGETSAP